MIALILLLIVDAGRIASQPQQVDLLELNHYQRDGRLHYTQIIAWQWMPSYRRYRPIGWTIVSELDEYPRTSRGITSTSLWRSTRYRETTTEHDPERTARELNQGIR